MENGKTLAEIAAEILATGNPGEYSVPLADEAMPAPAWAASLPSSVRACGIYMDLRTGHGTFLMHVGDGEPESTTARTIRAAAGATGTPGAL